MIRRRPAALYSVIDERELLATDAETLCTLDGPAEPPDTRAGEGRVAFSSGPASARSRQHEAPSPIDHRARWGAFLPLAFGLAIAAVVFAWRLTKPPPLAPRPPAVPRRSERPSARARRYGAHRSALLRRTRRGSRPAPRMRSARGASRGATRDRTSAADTSHAAARSMRPSRARVLSFSPEREFGFER
jgi:hypothetical protein